MRLQQHIPHRCARGGFPLVAVLAAVLLSSAFPARAAGTPELHWIYWGSAWEDAAKRAAETAPAPLSERALRRLARVGHRPRADEPTDRPVPAGFLRHLEEMGIRARVTSRFLRAVSAELTPEQRSRLAADPSVLRLEPVRTRRGPIPEPIERLVAPAGPKRAEADTLPDPRLLSRSDYGPAYAQCQQLGVTTLHRMGLSGHGVLVCVLDGGFYVRHETFAGADLVATRDFAEHDPGVSYDPTRPGQIYNTRRMNDHGTYTWSALGGFTAGRQIGPAYRASFALGRTEIVESETRLEEDLYVAGLEWADSLGADLVSTSLGYLRFDSNFEYWPEELDGRTAVTSRAAAILTRRGVLLVTAMGNDGPEPMTLATPADAESVCSVGAVDRIGRLATFSSRGPNALEQIKPDVCARGVATACASADSGTAYAAVHGTSLATPLLAGLAALLIEAHPEWTPIQVIEALRGAGDQRDAPDNNRGWGVPDGVAALGTFGPADPAVPLLELAGVGWAETANSAQGTYRDSLASPGEEGALILHLRNRGATLSTRPAWIAVSAASDGIEALGDSVQLGAVEPGGEAVPVGDLRVQIAADHPLPSAASLALRLRTNDGAIYYRSLSLPVVEPVWQLRPYPNPLLRGGELSLDVELPREGVVTVRVYDVSGRLRAEPYREAPVGERARFRWSPGRELPSGVYYLRIEGAGFKGTRRIVLIG